MKFNQHKETLLNRNVSPKLLLTFFDSALSPASFDLSTCSLSAAQTSQLDRCWALYIRRMLRSTAGLVCIVNDD